jgi:hypothetical protein
MEYSPISVSVAIDGLDLLFLHFDHRQRVNVRDYRGFEVYCINH